MAIKKELCRKPEFISFIHAVANRYIAEQNWESFRALATGDQLEWDIRWSLVWQGYKALFLQQRQNAHSPFGLVLSPWDSRTVPFSFGQIQKIPAVWSRDEPEVNT